MNYKLIISIVPYNCGKIIINAAVSAGARGGTIIMGRGTAANSVLQLLGLGDTSKEITYNIVEENLVENVKKSIISATEDKKAHFGVLFTVDVCQFLRAGISSEDFEGEKGMSNENDYQMINIIVNKGYAEDAMAAARKAGAGGGTIINARGTAKEGDAKFFGMDIVPEKDMLMILVPTSKKDEIIKAIKELPCFSKAGSGIIFCNNASDFTLLGKK